MEEACRAGESHLGIRTGKAEARHAGPMPRTIVITGASSGIGRATALRFAKTGEHLVLASRGEEALQALADECRREGAKVKVVPTDVADHAQVKELASTPKRIDVWINDAGVGAFAPFTELPVRELRRIVEVNLLGVAYGSREALKRMQEQGHGVPINLSSVLGEVPQPTAAAYAMTKAAIRSLSEALRSEMAPTKRIHVCTVLPEGIDTPFYRHAANHTGRAVKATPPVTSAGRVARAIVRLADHPRPETFVGRNGAILAAWHRLTPRPAEAAMAAITATAQFGDESDEGDDGAAPSSGILFAATTPDDATVSGGFHGTARTARRRVIAAAALVGIAALAIAGARRR